MLQMGHLQARLTTLFSEYMDEFEAIIEVKPVVGGDINRACHVIVKQKTKPKTAYFVKYNDVSHALVLSNEDAALRYFNQYPELNYPRPHFFASDLQYAYLVMPYLRLEPVSPKVGRQLGQMLAKQHQIQANQFGWKHDNHIGLSVQYNAFNHCWLEFLRAKRLQPQLNRAIKQGLDNLLVEQTQKIIDCLSDYFEGYKVVPSLLHGDLWSGNAAYDQIAGQVVLYDPAVYYGDRETDLAMTSLFGGFPDSFYQAYQSIYPLDSGYSRRCLIYNLYHGLNHFNLFGAVYVRMIQRILSQLN